MPTCESRDGHDGASRSSREHDAGPDSRSHFNGHLAPFQPGGRAAHRARRTSAGSDEATLEVLRERNRREETRWTRPASSRAPRFCGRRQRWIQPADGGRPPRVESHTSAPRAGPPFRTPRSARAGCNTQKLQTRLSRDDSTGASRAGSSATFAARRRRPSRSVTALSKERLEKSSHRTTWILSPDSCSVASWGRCDARATVAKRCSLPNLSLVEPR